MASLYSNDKGDWMLVGKTITFWKKMEGPIHYKGDCKDFTPYESHKGVNIAGLVWKVSANSPDIVAVKENSLLSFNLDIGILSIVSKK
jgi:hypothetical protein